MKLPRAFVTDEIAAAGGWAVLHYGHFQRYAALASAQRRAPHLRRDLAELARACYRAVLDEIEDAKARREAA